eukprot:jgi/Phyca11/526056/estExt2_fgenesh1_pm.C_PHYCAscaffold_60152
MDQSKVKPLGSVSREDVRQTLHTHFHSLKPAPRPSTGGVLTATASRKRFFSFIQVQKPKSEAETKRLFGHGTNASKHFVLCVTVQDANPVQLELHYVQLLSNLSVDTTLPRLVRINVEELQETANRLNLQKVYDIDVDLVQAMADMKKNGSLAVDPVAGEDTSGKKSVDNAGIDVSGLRLASPESNEALNLLNDVNWSEVQLSAVEEDLRKKLWVLEDENISFLLSLDGDALVAPSASNTKPSSVDQILEAIDAVQHRITLIQDWTNESDESLGQTSSSMQHFEALNNQLEMHFKNSVSLEEVLAQLMAKVEISKEKMKIFQSPVDVFPGEVGGSTTGVTSDRGDVGRDVGVTERIRTTVAAIAAIDQAIRSTQEYPASEMSLFAHLNSLDPRILVALRHSYTKHLPSVYNAHVQSMFRYLRDKLPRTSKHHFHKPTAIQSRGIHLSSSHFSVGDTMCASPLMQQALDHVIPLVQREQRLVTRLFFTDKASGKHEQEDLTMMMEGVFDKLLKRMNEFGEAAGSRNILDALALVVLVSGSMEEYRQQSAFLYNVMVSFQLQMKRMLIKFTEEQETWISAQNVDTKMAGVLGPTKKIVNMIARMEESGAGRGNDSTMVSIYNMIVPATMQWIDKIAESRPKYAALTRLENYLFLSDSLRTINSSPDLPLAQFADEAQERYNENLQRYVASVWEYAFKQLVPLISSIEMLMVTVPASEIQYHSPRQEVRRVLDATSSTFEKSVRVMHDRMKKHFRENSKMLPTVWKQLVAYGSSRMAVYALVAGDCYQLRFEPSPERGLELLTKFSFT